LGHKLEDLITGLVLIPGKGHHQAAPLILDEKSFVIKRQKSTHDNSLIKRLFLVNGKSDFWISIKIPVL